MKEINDTTVLRAVLENPLDFIDSTDTEEIKIKISNLFNKIARMLFERYDILIWDSKGKEHYYSFAEVEFYYHKKGILDRDVDNCVYPRTCEAGKFLWHDTGVDICFKSECDIENYYFGGILIRSLIEKESNQIIGGPGRCANELAFLCRVGDTPHLVPKKKEEKIVCESVLCEDGDTCSKKKEENIVCKTIRQGIDCDVDIDGKAKVEYCYFIRMKDGNWNRMKEVIKMNSDFKGYERKKVTFRYSDNPESNRIEKLMKKRKDNEKPQKDYYDR
jgi:hypothetical protein